MPDPNPYADAYSAYHAAGWIPLPLPYRKKSPPPNGYTGKNALRPSYADLAAWAGDRAPRNIAVRMPEGVIGLDVDSRDGKPGSATLEALEALHGPLPATATSSARGFSDRHGIHFFRMPSGHVTTNLRDPGPGIEAIRPEHRYAVVWPSMHPTGTTYVWSHPRPGYDRAVMNVNDLPYLPEAWAKALTPSQAAVAGLTQSDSDPFGLGLREWALEQATEERTRLTRELAAMGPESGRNNACNNAAMWCAHFGPEFWPPELAREWLLSAMSANGYIADEGQSAALATIRSGFEAGRKSWQAVLVPEVAVEPRSDEGEGVEPSGYEMSVLRELSKLRITDEARRRLRAERRGEEGQPEPRPLATWLQEPDDEVAYRIEDLQPSGTRVVLAAQAKAGKTTLTGNVVRSLADGVDLLGRFPVKPVDGHVVVLDFEMPAGKLKSWLRDQDVQNPEKVTVVPIRGKASSFDILDPGVRSQWAATLAGLQASYVVLDCLRPILDAIGLDEHKDAGKFLVALDELLDEAGAPEALLVHHMGHNGERSRGDSRIRDWPDVEWKITRADDGTRAFQAYGRDVDQPARQLWFDTMSRRLSMVDLDPRTARVRAAVPEVIFQLGVSTDAPETAKLVGWLRDGGMAKNLAEQAILEAEKMGYVQRKRVARTHYCGLTSDGVDYAKNLGYNVTILESPKNPLG